MFLQDNIYSTVSNLEDTAQAFGGELYYQKIS